MSEIKTFVFKLRREIIEFVHVAATGQEEAEDLFVNGGGKVNTSEDAEGFPEWECLGEKKP